MRAAEAVRDGKASAMVSAGNTGATMGSALLRMGRIKGVARPAIATPIPCPGADTPTVMLDAGANAECQPDWLVQFAQMGAVFARERYGIATPRVGLLSIGEEPGKGDSLRKETFALLAEPGLGRRGRLRRQRRGPGPHVARRRRGRHRRVHRQRGPQDPRGRHAGPGRRAGHRLRHRRRQPGRRRRPDAGAAAALRRARPRLHRGRHAPRRRRSVHHQPRIVVGGGHGQRHPDGRRHGHRRRRGPPGQGGCP